MTCTLPFGTTREWQKGHGRITAAGSSQQPAQEGDVINRQLQVQMQAWDLILGCIAVSLCTCQMSANLCICLLLFSLPKGKQWLFLGFQTLIKKKKKRGGGGVGDEENLVETFKCNLKQPIQSRAMQSTKIYKVHEISIAGI